MGEVSDLQLRPALSGKLQGSKPAPASITRKKKSYISWLVGGRKVTTAVDTLRARVQDMNTSNHVKEV